MRPPVPAAQGPDQPSILSRGRPSGQAQRCANCTTNRQAGSWNTPRRKAAMPSTIANQDAAEHADIPQSDSLEAIISLARRRDDLAAVWLYGSRARGDHHPESDFDLAVAYPGCCTGSVRSPQMPGSVGIKGIWGGVWLFFDQVPVLRAHLPPPPCLFCAGDSTPRRYPGTSLLANIRKRSCSGYWLFNISRMVRVLRVMTAPIFSSFRRMVLTWAWAKAVRLR